MEIKKERLDILVSRINGFSREYAKEIILGGDVFVDGKPKLKPGEKFSPDDTEKITVRALKMKYVSRGGYKLEKALNMFGIKLKDKVCMDVGASTGGFTDCMLQNGAAMVFAVDTGFGQLASELLADSRVVSMERTNITCVSADNLLGLNIQFIAVDVSFVSLTKIIESVCRLLHDGCAAVFLIKPQFEAGRGCVGKNGIVKDTETHRRVILSVCSCISENGMEPLGLTYSPIKGRDGNIEYLVYCVKDAENKNTRFAKLSESLVSNIISEAFTET